MSRPTIVFRAMRKMRGTYDLIRWGKPSQYGHLTRAVKHRGVHRVMEIGTFNGGRASEILDEACKFSDPQELEYYGFDMFEDLTHDQVEYVGRPLKHGDLSFAMLTLLAGISIDTRPLRY